MLDLETAQNKKDILSDYRGRRMIVWLWLLSVVIVSSFVMAMLIAYLSTKNNGTVKAYLSSDKSAMEQKDFAKMGQLVEETNEQLNLFFAGDIGGLTFAETVKKILGMKPAGVKISGIELGRKEASTAVSLRGTFGTRKAFNLFIETLSAEPNLGELVSPISNLLKMEKGDFTVSFVLSVPNVDKKR